MQIIFGLLEKISYHNEENDFVVAKLREKEKKELTTIVGNLSGINPGESLKLTGKWVHNKRFGEQFQVETFEVTVPATLLGIQKYLASGVDQRHWIDHVGEDCRKIWASYPGGDRKET